MLFEIVKWNMMLIKDFPIIIMIGESPMKNLENAAVCQAVKLIDLGTEEFDAKICSLVDFPKPTAKLTVEFSLIFQTNEDLKQFIKAIPETLAQNE